MGLTSTMNMASRSLGIFTTGIEVAGNNVANSSTPGYIREVLDISTSPPYKQGRFLIGAGADLNGIHQQIDKHLESRIHDANADAAAAAKKGGMYQQFQTILNELGDSDLSTSLNTMISSINDLINQPELTGIRTAVVDNASLLTSKISGMRTDITELRLNANTEITDVVDEANLLIDEVSALNQQIIRAETGGLIKSDAGALRTQRYVALNRLSEIIPIDARELKSGSVEIFSGSDYLILENQTHHIEPFHSTDRDLNVVNFRIKETKSIFVPTGGELKGLLDSRDGVLGDFVDQLDSYSAAIIHQFNIIHSSGEGLKGFESVEGTYKMEDTSLALNQAGLPFTPKHGSFEIKVINQNTGATETAIITIDLDGLGGNDTSLDDLQTALSAVTNLTASISPDGELKIDAADGFDFRFANDNSGTLAALGINTLFTGSSSNDIGVNAIVQNDPSYLATGQGGGDSDTRNAVLLADVIHQTTESLNGFTIDDFYEQMVSAVAQNGSSEKALANGLEGYRNSLLNQRSQISGVSLDEEAVRILQYQQAYQAAAKIITTADELFNTLLSL